MAARQVSETTQSNACYSHLFFCSDAGSQGMEGEDSTAVPNCVSLNAVERWRCSAQAPRDPHLWADAEAIRWFACPGCMLTRPTHVKGNGHEDESQIKECVKQNSKITAIGVNRVGTTEERTTNTPLSSSLRLGFPHPASAKPRSGSGVSDEGSVDLPEPDPASGCTPLVNLRLACSPDRADCRFSALGEPRTGSGVVARHFNFRRRGCTYMCFSHTRAAREWSGSVEG